MEIILSIVIGAWIGLAGLLAYVWLKKEFTPFLKDDGKPAGGHGDE